MELARLYGLDADMDGGKMGSTSLAQLSAQMDLSTGWIFRTGGGGLHYVFRRKMGAGWRVM